MFCSPIWVENYGNCVSTSSLEGIYGPLELLGGLRNMEDFFCGVEGKVWELWEFSVEGVWLFCIKFIGGGSDK